MSGHCGSGGDTVSGCSPGLRLGLGLATTSHITNVRFIPPYCQAALQAGPQNPPLQAVTTTTAPPTWGSQYKTTQIQFDPKTTLKTLGASGDTSKAKLSRFKASRLEDDINKQSKILNTSTGDSPNGHAKIQLNSWPLHDTTRTQTDPITNGHLKAILTFHPTPNGHLEAILTFQPTPNGHLEDFLLSYPRLICIHPYHNNSTRHRSSLSSLLNFPLQGNGKLYTTDLKLIPSDTGDNISCLLKYKQTNNNQAKKMEAQGNRNTDDSDSSSDSSTDTRSNSSSNSNSSSDNSSSSSDSDSDYDTPRQNRLLTPASPDTHRRSSNSSTSSSDSFRTAGDRTPESEYEDALNLIPIDVPPKLVFKPKPRTIIKDPRLLGYQNLDFNFAREWERLYSDTFDTHHTACPP